MWKWFTSWGSVGRERLTATAEDSEGPAAVRYGKYRSLYRYLENRYADVTVLTFDQIEDLLGFALPQLARTTPAWWAMGATDGHLPPPHSAAWILAGRTATANLVAKTVLFERTAPVSRKRG